MIITAEAILTFVAVTSALGAMIGVIFSAYRWYLKQEKQDIEIKAVKEEQCIMVYGLLACLKGLQEQGCNGPVTEAVGKLEKHINKKAHDC